MQVYLYSVKMMYGWGFANTLTFAFTNHLYLVCILFGMTSLHLFTFLMFFQSCFCIFFVQYVQWSFQQIDTELEYMQSGHCISHNLIQIVSIVAQIIRQPFKDTQADPWSVYSIRAHLCFSKQ